MNLYFRVDEGRILAHNQWVVVVVGKHFASPPKFSSLFYAVTVPHCLTLFKNPSRVWSFLAPTTRVFVIGLCFQCLMLYIDLRPRQACHSKDGGSCIFHWRGRAWLTIWDRVKIPRYSHKLMYRKRVTCELHDSYLRSMTIKHAIPKTAEVHILIASYGKILSGRWTII